MKHYEQVALRDRLKRRLIWKVPLILALVGFAVWWQAKHHPVSAPSARSDWQLSSPLTGNWSAQSSGPSDGRADDQFFFQPEADKLYGTVSHGGVKRGIEDGKISGAFISFYASFEDPLNDPTRQRRYRYEGGFTGDVILLKRFDDAGSPPMEFSLTKSGGAIEEGTHRR